MKLLELAGSLDIDLKSIKDGEKTYKYFSSFDFMKLVSQLTNYSINLDQEKDEITCNFFIDKEFYTFRLCTDDNFWDIICND